jgi:hypothetical protein
VRIVASKLTPYSKQLKVKIPYVAGDVVGSKRLSERLAAAMPNVKLAPH